MEFSRIVSFRAFPLLSSISLSLSLLLRKLTISRVCVSHLSIVDWSNVILGGGSVLACLQNQQNSEEYRESDFDLFLYGLKPDQVRSRVLPSLLLSLSLPTSDDREDDQLRVCFNFPIFLFI